MNADINQDNRCLLCGKAHAAGMHIGGCLLCFECERKLLAPGAALRLSRRRRQLLRLYQEG